MEIITADDPETKSPDLVAENLARLKELFPEIVTEGKDGVSVNIDVLKQLVGDKVVTDAEEKYGLNWHGKRRARQLALTPSTGTLRPCPEESVDWDTTQNLMIEGDNLEVLKLLQKSYAGRVKLIYIDPPYNTGKDFVYPDDFRDNIKNYLELTGQTGDEGRKLSSNTEASGRFHTDWLNMMYPRLKLARNLLREDGVIFISIGDQEIHNLRALMNDIFGEENYVNTVCVKAKPSAGASGGGEDKRLKKNAEFLLVYAKNRESETALDVSQAYDETELTEHIASMRDDEKSWKYTRAITDFGSRELATTTKDGDGNEIKVFRHSGFRFESISELIGKAKSEADAYLKNFETVFRDTNAQSSIRTRVMEALGTEDGFFSIEYIPRSGRNKGQPTTVYYKGSNKDQIAWLKDIGRKTNTNVFIRGKTGTLWTDFNWNNVSKEGETVFPNGKKPIAFIQRMLQLATRQNESDVVLDFFAGSGSTAHAVMDANQIDSGNRQFIQVQLPEPADSSGFDNISDLCKERLRRAGKKIKAENPMFAGDLGFRVFKLDSSNIREWDPDREDLAGTLEAHAKNLKSDRSEQDILFELLLKLGLDLTVPVEKRKVNGGGKRSHDVHSVGGGVLMVCLSPAIGRDDVEPLAIAIIDWRKEQAPAGDSTVVFRDNAFADDVAKTNLAAILQQNGLTNVRSL